jgi:PAS domain S-box-containing protein
MINMQKHFIALWAQFHRPLFTFILAALLFLGSKIDTFLFPMQATSGIGVAVILLFGLKKSTPGFLLGIIVINLTKGAGPALLFTDVLASFIEAAFGGKALLMILGRKEFKFEGSRDILLFLAISVILTPALSSTVAVTSFVLLDTVPWYSAFFIWITYFMGNSLGILVFTPVFLSFFQSRELFKTPVRHYLEGGLLFVLTSLVSQTAFDIRKEFLVYPFILWAALRFRYLGVSVATLIICLVAVWTSTRGSYIFDSSSLEMDLLWIQGFVGISSLSGYFLSNVIDTEKRAGEKEHESKINLQQKQLAEDALNLLDQAIEKSPVGFALVDSQFRYIKINEAFCQINGKRVDEHIGKTIREMVPNIALNVEEIITHVFQTGESILSVPIKGKLRNEPFKEISGLISYYPIKRPGGRSIFGVAISFEDLTDQHRVERMLRENQSRLNFAQEAGKMGVFDWRFSTSEVHWTPQLEAIYGLDKGEFGGYFENWIKFIHPDDLGKVKGNMKIVFKENVDLGMQFRIIRKDGAIRWILSRGGVIRDSFGNTIGFSGINVDITEQKSIEERLRRAEGELLEALAARDEFFAIASHELKTPLTSLKLQVQIHQRAIEKKDPLALTHDKVSQLLHKNLSQLQRLNRLVEDMLDISRIRTGKLSLKKERCEISAILKDILSRSREQFLTCGSGEPIVAMEGEAFGHWDSLRIEQVISNVINNAIRYGLGNPIAIKLAHFHEKVCISVTDKGMGIAPEDEKRIFQRFERGKLTLEVSGLGLGLFISKQIIDAHSGNIWIESKLGAGTTFHIELPLLESPKSTLELNLAYKKVCYQNNHEPA